ncbi:MAG: hypothetical protein L0Z62_35810 [Gemmataceae bacterium]|nr:hypothetical protein [Gemmataceae bacterium]
MSRLGGILALAVVFLALGGTLTNEVANGLLYSQTPFDSERWRAGDKRQRARMIGDLHDQGILLGKSRAEVIELLGPPDSVSGRTVYYSYTHGDWLGDWLKLPYAGWSYVFWVGFDETSQRANGVGVWD